MGLLDIFGNQDPEFNRGLLAAAAQFGGGPSNVPRNFMGQAVSGMQAYNASMDADKKRKLQEEEDRIQREYRGLQVREMQGGLSDRDAARQQAAEMARLQQDFSRQYWGDVGAPSQSEQQPMQLSSTPMSATIGRPAAQQQQGPYDQAMAYAQFLQKNGRAQDAMRVASEAQKLKPKYSATPQKLTGPDGKLGMYQVSEDGSPALNMGLGAAPEMVEVGLGDQKKFIDRNSITNGQSFKIGVDPGTVYGGNITMRGQNMTDARARELNDSRIEENRQKAIIGKAPTEFQGKSAAFGLRATEADKILNNLDGKYSPATINAKQAADDTWLVGGAMGAAVNKFAMSSEDQRAEQAQRDFVNAVLRQESGAAIGATEFANAKKQYFPQPGDLPDVIAQKATNRQLAIQGFQANAGRAALTAPSSQPVKKSAMKGQVMDGYRFKGGDPSDQNNWEKI